MDSLVVSVNKQLRKAAKDGDVANMIALLNKGASPLACSGFLVFGSRNTALHFAAASGHEQAVHLLLSRRADPNAKNALGLTPADLACKAGNFEVAQILQQQQQQQEPYDSSSVVPPPHRGFLVSCFRGSEDNTSSTTGTSNDQSVLESCDALVRAITIGDADSVCQHVTALSATGTHTVMNPLAVVQQLLNVTAAAGCDWMDPTMKRLLMQQVHRFLSSAFSSSMSSARPLHASTKTDIASALQRVLSLITEHRNGQSGLRYETECCIAAVRLMNSVADDDNPFISSLWSFLGMLPSLCIGIRFFVWG